MNKPPSSALSRRDMIAASSIASIPSAQAGSGEVGHGQDEHHHVAADHTSQVVLRWGDPLFADAPDWDPNNQSAAAQSRQFGSDCDFTAFMPLPRGSNSSDRGLLCVNHEAARSHLMFPGIARRRDEKLTRQTCETEMAAHGHTVVEVFREGNDWRINRESRFNRRFTMLDTPMELTGPAAGHARLKTTDDPTGRAVVGTLGNCAGGVTPWGTVITAEENIHHYFGGDPAGTREADNHVSFGITKELNYAWDRFVPRFNVENELHEPNRYGWLVEIDPYDPMSTPKKLTALGRFKHECAGVTLAPDGRVVVYSGDDEIFQFIYRFVSSRPIGNADVLDDGVLAAARFNDDGSLEWLPLVWGRGPLTPANGFDNQGDVLIESRRAARLLGATAMDRPECIVPCGQTGTVFVALTKNANRAPEQINAANPRAENRNGHILELIPPGNGVAETQHAAEKFAWRPFLLAGNPRESESGAQYNGPISDAAWFACPDNLAFDPRGRLWITTDGLGDFGLSDGAWITAVDGTERARPYHILRGPIGSELTGPSFTPDGRTFFCSVQHPGDGSSFDRPSTRWPDFKDGIPPRSAVLAIRRTDGGAVG